MENNKKRIVFFVNSFCGGAERVTISIANHINPNVFEVIIVVYNANKNSEIYQFISKSIKVVKIDWQGSFDALFKIIKILKDLRPHIVFCSMMPINNFVIIASMLIGNIKVVVRNNNMLSEQKKHKNPFLLAKFLYKHADTIIAQTEEMASDIERILNVPEKRIKVIHNPVDLDYIIKKANEKSPFTEENPKFVCVARFTYNKGQDILIKAFSLLHKEMPNAKLYLIGKLDDSLYLNMIITMIEDLGLKENVILSGFQNNPYVWIKNSSCFVLPSRIEGLPNVLLESLSLKTPVVATRSIPIIDRIVQNGVNGYTVEVDDVVSMSNAMKKAVLLENVDLTFGCSSYSDFEQEFKKVLYE